MRGLARNEQTVYYATYSSRAAKTNGGYKTGEYTVTYSSPVRIRANVSSASGRSYEALFGIQKPYSHTLVTHDMNCPISETSILWIGITPDVNGETGNVKHNFEVVSVAKSINCISYAIVEVRP